MFFNSQKKPKIHLIGIGGSGMSGIAEVLLAEGFKVTGSDLNLSHITKRLEELGAKIFQGHDSKNIGDANCIVVSSAVKKDNPEWQKADQLSIPVIARAEMLAELMRLKKGVAVAGSHGKTTTTSILGQILRPIDPTVVVGGRLQHWDASSIVGRGEVFVIEADESDRSFLKFSPVYSIVTNIDLEHLETYSSLEDIEDTFVEFLNRTAFFGQNWIGADCDSLKKIRSRLTKPTKTYGFDKSADLRITRVEFSPRGSSFELEMDGDGLGVFKVPLVGKHNILNITAAIGCALSLGLSVKKIRESCKDLVLADRRLQVHFDGEYAAVVEDYGHHPTEIKATLEALELMYPKWNKTVIFQPHRYSRTKALWGEFAESLEGGCDKLYLLPIYSAHEPMIDGITSEKLAKTFQKLKVELCSDVPSVSKIANDLNTSDSERQLVLILGAAPLTQLAKDLSAELSKTSAKRQIV